jgi:quinol monooxygenase YgiN
MTISIGFGAKPSPNVSIASGAARAPRCTAPGERKSALRDRFRSAGNVSPAPSPTGEERGAMACLELSARLSVRPGCLEGFKKQAAEILRITKEKDTRTLRYDWFLSSDGTECEVREAYTGPEGLIEHNAHVLEARTKLFEDYADNHFMMVYGEPSKPLLDLLHAHQVGHKWFRFLQGLEPSPEAL